ncbi:MAG: hypothetical protein LBI72_09860 [Flavobacteriaceae bacterium]|jgi:hypothetical protein|nr:hypothetical protein [Flavobacteriaceae bacterium]
MGQTKKPPTNFISLQAVIIEKNKFIPEDLYKLTSITTKKEIQVFKSTFESSFK